MKFTIEAMIQPDIQLDKRADRVIQRRQLCIDEKPPHRSSQRFPACSCRRQAGRRFWGKLQGIFLYVQQHAEASVTTYGFSVSHIFGALYGEDLLHYGCPSTAEITTASMYCTWWRTWLGRRTSTYLLRSPIIQGVVFRARRAASSLSL